MTSQAKATCWVCGKRARRHCPAAGNPICPACCGSKRGNEIECTSDCEFFPFGVAGYDLWLKLDDSVLPKLARRAVDQFGQDQFGHLCDSLRAPEARGVHTADFAFYSALHLCLSVLRDKNGATLADRWKAQGWAGLKPDEAALMEHRSKSFVTVIEVQRVLDRQRVECVDLFSDSRSPFVVLDRSLAGSAVRFSRIFGWLTHYPGFSKIGHAGYIVPDMVRREFIELVRSLGGPESEKQSSGRQPVPDKRSGGVHADGVQPGEAAIRQVILNNLSALVLALVDLPRDKMRRILRSMDVCHCTGFYRLVAPREDLVRILETKPDFERVDEEPAEGDPPGTWHYDWHRLGESQEFEKQMIGVFRHSPGDSMVGTLGALRINRDGLVFETFARAKYEFGKKMIDKYFGGLVAFERETALDLARQAAERHGKGGAWDVSDVSGLADSREYADDEIQAADRGDKADPAHRGLRVVQGGPSDVPPEVQAQIMKEYFVSHYTKFLDDAVPALGGLSPREAAKDPKARPLLLELMKEHICGIERDKRDRGVDIDIRFVLKELGLDELL